VRTYSVTTEPKLLEKTEQEFGKILRICRQKNTIFRRTTAPEGQDCSSKGRVPDLRRKSLPFEGWLAPTTKKRVRTPTPVVTVTELTFMQIIATSERVAGQQSVDGTGAKRQKITSAFQRGVPLMKNGYGPASQSMR